MLIAVSGNTIILKKEQSSRVDILGGTPKLVRQKETMFNVPIGQGKLSGIMIIPNHNGLIIYQEPYAPPKHIFGGSLRDILYICV